MEPYIIVEDWCMAASETNGLAHEIVDVRFKDDSESMGRLLEVIRRRAMPNLIVTKVTSSESRATRRWF
jgi:hypothetical protein